MAPKKKLLKPKKNNLIKQKQKQKHNTNNIIIHIDQSKRTNPRQPSASKPPLQIPIAIPPVNYHPLQFQQHALPHPPQPTPPVAQPIVQHIHQPQQQPQGEPQITRNEYNDFMNSFTNRMNNLNNKMDNYFNTDTQSNNSFESVLNDSYKNNSPTQNFEKTNPELFETPKHKKPNIIIVDDTPKKQQPDTPIDTSYSYVRKPNTTSTKLLTNNDTFKTPKIIAEPIFKANLLLEPPKEEPNVIKEALINQTIDTPANVIEEEPKEVNEPLEIIGTFEDEYNKFMNTYFSPDKVFHKCIFCNIDTTGKNQTQSLISHYKNQHLLSTKGPYDTVGEDEKGDYMISREHNKRYVFPGEIINNIIKKIQTTKQTMTRSEIATKASKAAAEAKKNKNKK